MRVYGSSEAEAWAYGLNDAERPPDEKHDMALCIDCGRRVEGPRYGAKTLQQCFDCAIGEVTNEGQ